MRPFAIQQQSKGLPVKGKPFFYSLRLTLRQVHLELVERLRKFSGCTLRVLMWQLSKPILLASVLLTFALSPFGDPQGLSLIPSHQDPGQQTTLWTATTITTTAQAQTVACPQGSGSVGRKTLAVHNTGAGAVTVTVELRDTQAGPNITSGYLAVNGLAQDTANSDTATPAEAGGAFCRVSATSASTSVITATLRRE